MYNSEAQRYARWSATVAVLLVVLVAGVYLQRSWQARQVERRAPPAVPSTIEQRSAEFSYSRVEGPRTIFTVRASRATEFKEGARNLLEDVSISVYGRKGERNDRLRTKACDFISTTGKITCAGDIQMDLQSAGRTPADSDAIHVMTSNISFDRDSGETKTDEPVTFRWPSGEGRAIGLEYYSSNGTLQLNRNVELTLMASSRARLHQSVAQTAVPSVAPQVKTFSLNGDRLVFRRDNRTVQMLGTVRGQQDTYELVAENLLLELDAALHSRHLTASGHPHFHDSDERGPMDLDGDEISASLAPEGSIESIVADGNVHGSRSTSAGADNIQAQRIRLTLATRQDVPRVLTANGDVTMTSRDAKAAGGTRNLVTEALQLNFADGSRLASANTLAPARIEWQNIATLNGIPIKQTTRMHGGKMNLKFDGQGQLQQLMGSGGIEVTRQLGAEPEQTTTSREVMAEFTGGEWSTIDQTGDVRLRQGARTAQGERAQLDRIANTVTLTGSVILADAATRTTAQSAILTLGSNELRADGHVLTIEARDGTGGLTNLASSPGHISAGHLMVDTVRGHAVYSGGGRLWQGESVIEADTIELDNSSQILTSRGHVRGVFPQSASNVKQGQPALRPASVGSKADVVHVMGGLLTYWGRESRARLEQDASADSAEGSIHANLIDLYFSPADAANSTKQLERAMATGDVTVRQEDRRGTSNQAEYTAGEGKFVLSGGNPTLYDSTGDTTTGRELTFYFADDRIVIGSEEGLRTVTLHRVEK